jgi:hypothetical protein
MSVSVDGRLTVHPWLRHHLRSPGPDASSFSILGEDAFSLIVGRSVIRGLASFHGQAPPNVRWGHNDAGGDWTPDGALRRLAWFQFAVPDRPLPGRRLPVQPAVSIVAETLAQVGVVELGAVHVIAPLAAAPDGRADLIAIPRWFSLADPASADEVLVTVNVPAEPAVGYEELIPVARTRTVDSVAISAASPGDAHAVQLVEPPYGQAWLLSPDGSAPPRHSLAFRCSIPTWTMDTACWLVEVFLEALRELGVTEPAAITVARLHERGSADGG